MKRIEKAIRANELRRTRFHTARGQLMPLAAWLASPRLVVQRLSGTHVNGPWMVPAAVDAIAELLGPESRVWEFGSGYSTPWYAERAGHIVSVEHDAGWAKTVGERLGAAASRCELRLVPPEDLADSVSAAADDSLDLVVVDSNPVSERLACVAAAAAKVRPGGHLVLDDSDLPAVVGADDLLRGWAVRRFVGLKASPLTVVETSLYRRPQVAGNAPSERPSHD